MKCIKIITALPFLSIIIAGFCFGGQLPGAGDVDQLSKESLEALHSFMQETFVERAGFEFNGHYIEVQQRQKVLRLGVDGANRLNEIIHSQENIRTRIEEYEGLDWEQLYGVTGLWRKAAAEIALSRWRKCRVDLYAALASTGDERRERLQGVIESCDESLPEKERTLLAAKARWYASKDKNFKLTVTELDPIMSMSDFNEKVYFETLIFIINNSPQSYTKQLYTVAEMLKKSRFTDDFELFFKLVLLELKTPGEKLLAERPEAANIAGSIILDRLNAEMNDAAGFYKTINTTSVYRTELAAWASLGKKNDKYNALFDGLCQIEKFRRGIVFLAAAESNRRVNPAKAVDHYIEAALKADQIKSLLPSVSADQIALKAAQLGYQLFYKNSKYCPVAEKAMEVYCGLTGNKTDEQIEYLYATLLIECGKAEKGALLLKKISGNKGRFANAARLDLIFYQVKTAKANSSERKLLKQELKLFVDSIVNSNADENSIKNDALELYCKLLLEEGGKENAMEVLSQIREMPRVNELGITILKAGALAETGNLIDAVTLLADAISNDDCKAANLSAALVSEGLEKIDQLKEQIDDFDGFADDCESLANYRLQCCTDETLENIYQQRLIEIGIIAAGSDTKKLGALERELDRHGLDDDVDRLRCWGRLFMARGNWRRGFETWQRIAGARKPLGISTVRDDKWWRAKYYSLLCWSKLPETKRTQVRHAVEVLVNSMEDIPAFWGEKLDGLR